MKSETQEEFFRSKWQGAKTLIDKLQFRGTLGPGLRKKLETEAGLWQGRLIESERLG